MAKLLCFFGLHRWTLIARISRIYRCERCDVSSVEKEMDHG